MESNHNSPEEEAVKDFEIVYNSEAILHRKTFTGTLVNALHLGRKIALTIGGGNGPVNVVERVLVANIHIDLRTEMKV